MSNGWTNDEIGRNMEGSCRGLISDTTSQVYVVTKENLITTETRRD